MNDGDWIENCSALVEDSTGKLELIDWVVYTKQDTVSELDFSHLDTTNKAA